MDYSKIIYIIFVGFFLFDNVKGNVQRVPCLTPEPSVESVQSTIDDFQDYKRANQGSRDTYPVHIYVAWHVIYASNNAGYISMNVIENSIATINEEYNEYDIYFTLDTVTYHQNDDWWGTFSGSSQGENEEDMRSSTYTDPAHYYNIWSTNLSGTGACAWNYFPNSGENSYWQGTTVDVGCLGGNSTTLPHELGHYFYLFHTFQYGCDSPGDAVEDTPFHTDLDGSYPCSESLDTCPDDDGLDPVHNHMNYSSDACRNELTPGQVDRAFWAIENYHPSLLENQFYYPELYAGEFNYQFPNNLNSDGDGVFNPGESARVRVNIGNSWGADAEGVTAILRTDDNRLNILDSIIVFTNAITAGEISFTILDWFEIEAVEGSSLGLVPCELYITTNSTEHPYEVTEEVFVNISINQYGFPTDGYTIKSSPMITDLDGNGLKEIYFGSDDGNMYATMIAGTEVAGFPFETGDDIKSSPAVGDVDNDGDQELVFGSKDRTLYIVNKGGAQESSYIQTGYIIGAPALVDLDGDADLEIIFCSQNGSEGKVYAIHHNGTDVTGFPVDIAEKMVVGPAVADLEGDGVFDIAVTTWGEHIYAIDAAGNVKEGFPFVASRRFNAPPVIADFDGDGDLEIAAGNDDGNLYVLHHDASLMVEYSVGDDIRGGLAVADLDSDGSLELVFTGYDDHIHVWSPSLNTELSGWPVDMGSNSLTGPVIADLDNDGDLEVVSSTKTGDIYALEHDGSLLDYFPFTVAGNVESSPAIGDLDNDGDFELIFGTTMGLQVLDIKSEAGDVSSWKLHRGNNYRSGYYGLTMASVSDDAVVIPEAFYVSKNYPNPFNPTTSVRISTVEEGRLSVNIYDLSGRLVNSLINENVRAGVQTLTWDGSNKFGELVPTGVYFLQVVSGVDRHLQKMALVK